VGETADVGDLLGLNPLALFGDGSGAVIGALGHGAHMLYFCTINHGNYSFLSKDDFVFRFSHILYIHRRKKSITTGEKP
jgi:hypothetical protein